MRWFSLFVIGVILISVVPISFAAAKCYLGGDEALAQCNEAEDDCNITPVGDGKFVVCVVKGSKLVQPECANYIDCGANKVCNAGKCEDKPVECNADADCGEGNSCKDNICVTPEKPVEEKPVEKKEELPAGVVVSGGVSDGVSKSLVFNVEKDDENADIKLSIEKDPVDNIEKPKLSLNFDIKTIGSIPKTLDVEPKDIFSLFFRPFLLFNSLAILVVLGFIIKDFVVVPSRKF